jgi:phosphoribosyl 1,2-cyclic phosphodiesterase
MTRSSQGEITARFYGTRGSIPSPAADNLRYGGNTSCVELRFGSELLILDAGSGLRLLGEELMREAEGKPVEASLLLSHSHWDHIQGLPFFRPGYATQNRFEIFTAFGQSGRLHRALTNQMSPPHFPVGFNQMWAMRAPQDLRPEEANVGSFAIRTVPLNHPGGCSGFRVEAGGQSLAYLPDHEPYNREAGTLSCEAHESLVRFISGVDLLILDTQYTPNEYAQRVGWGHGCLPDSVALAMEAGAKRLFLFHHDPSHNDTHIDSMVAEARALAAGSGTAVEAATEGQSVTLSNRHQQSTISCPLPDTTLPESIAAL